MPQSDHDRRVDHIEFGATDIAPPKAVYQPVFGRKVGDDAPVRPANPLVVIFATRLEDTEAKIKQAGGKIVKQTYSFPGGRRFHFSDPSGNELAVWTDQ